MTMIMTYTLTQLQTLRFDIHYNVVDQGFTLRQLWQIERHDGLTRDTFAEFCNDVLHMLANEAEIEQA